MRFRLIQLRRGFTLIELLVVMSILVVLLLVALPVFNYVTGARSTESGLNLAAAMIGRARALALSRSDDKLVGVLFYTNKDDDRDAMQIVEVEATNAGSELERYFAWQGSSTGSPTNPGGGTAAGSAAQYQKIRTDPTDPRPADTVYATALDPLTGAGVPFIQRPVVKRYVAKNDSSNSPPPGGTLSGTDMVFVNAIWDVSYLGNTIPVSLDAEVQYMPRGVRARVVKRVGSSPVGRPAGMILFDKQGRLVQRKWGITSDKDPTLDGGEKLLEAMGLTTDMPIADERTSGVAIAVYNDEEIVANDPKDPAQVDKWIVPAKATDDFGPSIYTVSLQSGELIGGPTK